MLWSPRHAGPRRRAHSIAACWSAAHAVILALAEEKEKKPRKKDWAGNLHNPVQNIGPSAKATEDVLPTQSSADKTFPTGLAPQEMLSFKPILKEQEGLPVNLLLRGWDPCLT